MRFTCYFLPVYRLNVGNQSLVVSCNNFPHLNVCFESGDQLFFVGCHDLFSSSYFKSLQNGMFAPFVSCRCFPTCSQHLQDIGVQKYDSKKPSDYEHADDWPSGRGVIEGRDWGFFIAHSFGGLLPRKEGNGKNVYKNPGWGSKITYVAESAT